MTDEKTNGRNYTQASAAQNRAHRGLTAAVLTAARRCPLPEFTKQDLVDEVRKTFPDAPLASIGNSLSGLARGRKLKHTGHGHSGTYARTRFTPRAVSERVATGSDDALIDQALEALVTVEKFLNQHRELKRKFAALQAALS